MVQYDQLASGLFAGPRWSTSDRVSKHSIRLIFQQGSYKYKLPFSNFYFAVNCTVFFATNSNYNNEKPSNIVNSTSNKPIQEKKRLISRNKDLTSLPLFISSSLLLSPAHAAFPGSGAAGRGGGSLVRPRVIRTLKVFYYLKESHRERHNCNMNGLTMVCFCKALHMLLYMMTEVYKEHVHLLAGWGQFVGVCG